jgi:hypothetical protein
MREPKWTPREKGSVNIRPCSAWLGEMAPLKASGAKMNNVKRVIIMVMLARCTSAGSPEASR